MGVVMIIFSQNSEYFAQNILLCSVWTAGFEFLNFDPVGFG